MNTNKTLADIIEHIGLVRNYLKLAIKELQLRADLHDLTKTRSPELEAFSEVKEKLSNLEYGSQEYFDCLKELGPALEHHYKHNTHHPEHYHNGINGMNLFDILEMLADWQAASLKTKDGSLEKSLLVNKERFGIDDQLYQILDNTRKSYGW